MKYTTYTAVLCSALILTVLCPSVQSDSGLSASAESENQNSDPFGAFGLQKPPEPEKISEPTGEKTPPLYVETVNLRFLDADNLKNALIGMSSKYGSIASNEKSNSLIISDTKENLNRILEQIKKADKAPQQIMIEVVIADVQINDDTKIGVNWDILSDKNYDVAFRQNFTDRLGSTAAGADADNLIDTYNTTGTGGDFSIISGNVRNVVHLLQEKTDLEILASPRVMMVSGKEASIEAVEEIPYQELTQTSGGGELSSTEFKDVGVKLQVGATITDSNQIHIILYTEQKVKTGESSSGVPIVDARTAETDLLLTDGQVVVFGGLRQKTNKQVEQKVPFLGDLPLLGALFKTNNTVIENSELMVFLAPHIYKNKAPTKAQMKKYNKIHNQPILELPVPVEEDNLLNRILNLE
jgi:type II secretory pathway component GspD/PulD (secretin)